MDMRGTMFLIRMLRTFHTTLMHFVIKTHYDFFVSNFMGDGRLLGLDGSSSM